ncbi:hypothetical protein [Streptosporangium sandarakinum]|uniref:Uncharacterized protein n=1 Tax=Streptosporangium sandarakinum TaxID=1260955 RepID=A0A852V3W6_9ACTN|nr:hypothetical protein [Streptosporangium sandarakinum]
MTSRDELVGHRTTLDGERDLIAGKARRIAELTSLLAPGGGDR